VAATAVMYLRLGVIIAFFDLRFAWALAPALGTLFVAQHSQHTSGEGARSARPI
jgi:hypothetical protein